MLQGSYDKVGVLIRSPADLRKTTLMTKAGGFVLRQFTNGFINQSSYTLINHGMNIYVENRREEVSVVAVKPTDRLFLTGSQSENEPSLSITELSLVIGKAIQLKEKDTKMVSTLR